MSTTAIVEPAHHNMPRPSAEHQTNHWLKVFEHVWIDLPGSGKINIATSLKNLPRSGKALRIVHYALDFPKRSVYDHIRSLGLQGDHFLTITGASFPAETLGDLAAFHDLNEVIVGDVPRFTDPQIAKEYFKSPDQKRRMEDKADCMLAELLPGDIKDVFLQTRSVMTDDRSPISFFFEMIDQTDPIIAIWRYLHLFRNRLDLPRFLIAMNDFFINPSVRAICIDPLIQRLIGTLQNPALALKFANDPISLVSIANETGIGRNEIVKLIERDSMHFVNQSATGSSLQPTT